MPRHASKSTIDRETDARFWAQTGYRVGQRLDPSDPVDRAMAAVWRDVWSKVRREDDEGRLVLTYNHPDAERGLADAELASHAAVAHLEAAAGAPDPVSAAEHADAAASSAAAANSAADAVATLQPPTVSPSVADAAAAVAAAVAGIPPQVPMALPDDHPATAADRDHAPPAAPIPDPPGPAVSADPGFPRSAAQGQIAAVQAASAPSRAARLHERAAAATEPPPAGAIRPRAIADVREVAARIAAEIRDPAVGVVCYPEGGWSAPRFSSRGEAAAWYHHLTDTPAAFRYAAYFDHATADPRPVEEVFGSSGAIGAARGGADPGRPGDRAAVIYYAAGAAVVVAGLALLLGKRTT